MRARLLAAGVAALMVLGGTVAYGAAASTDVACTITDNTLSCPLPTAAPVTVTETVTAPPVTVTAPAVTVTATATVTATTTVAPPATTTAPVTTTAATTTATPPPTGFPNASNTGVPAGVTLAASGSLNLTTAGQVVDAKNITGTVYINANNVTLKRSKVTGSGFNIIRVEYGRTGVRIEDVEVNGRGTAGTAGSNGILGPATVVRANIYGVENGLVPDTGSVIQDSWVHNLASGGSPHFDGVQMDGDLTNVMIDHNTIDLSGLGQTGAIMVDNYFGQASNITVKNSRLLGGGYTVYCDGNFQTAQITGISYLNNRIAGGQWGPFLIRNCAATVTGNVNDSSGAPING